MLKKMVQAGGVVNVRHLTPDELYAAYSLGRRHYIRCEGDDYVFNIGYLYHFLKKKQQLIAFRPTDSGPRGPLRFYRGKVFRGYERIYLDEDEYHLFTFLHERKESPLVPSRTIFDYMGAVDCFTLSGAESPATRNARVKALVMKLHRSIEDDADLPVYLVDIGAPDAGLYRLQNVESD